MEKKILQTIRYFGIFLYAPTPEEIYMFLPVKKTREKLDKTLKKMVLSQKIVRKNGKYTLEEYGIESKGQRVKSKIARLKIERANMYIKILSLFPQIRLVGLSGSVAMMQAKKDDDVDFFVITARNRLWTGRLISLVLASLVGLRRRRGVKKAKDKVCLNLFFDEKRLKVPKFKQNYYVAHEILQMRPLFSKQGAYERFLKANKWVFKIFPNVREALGQKSSRKYREKLENFRPSHLGNLLENVFKKLQLISIKQHQTNEIVTDTQLWFFPDDFEKRIIRK